MTTTTTTTTTMKLLLLPFLLLLTLLRVTTSFAPPLHIATISSSIPRKAVNGDSNDDDDDGDKFSFGQRIESTKTGIVGLLAGGIVLTPFSAIHDIFLGGDFIRNGVAQWEFDTDMGSLEGALFAIVYRYCIRKDDNPMLNQGVIGAFILVRTLSKIQIPTYCSAIPLDCKYFLICCFVCCWRL
jgi:hypothetical protein